MSIRNFEIQQLCIGESVYLLLCGNCVFTGKPYSVAVTGTELERLKQGEFVQTVLPHLHPLEREFLISGVCPEGIDLYLNRDADRTFRFDELEERKTNWMEFERLLDEQGIEHLYHFTDESNVASIERSWGLLSHSRLQEGKFSSVEYSSSAMSRQIDRQRGYDKYVRLSFLKHHPMMYVALKEGRIRRPVVYVLSKELVYRRSTHFTSENALRSGAIVEDTIGHFRTIRFDLMRLDQRLLGEDERRSQQAEVLIRQSIPMKYVVDKIYP